MNSFPVFFVPLPAKRRGFFPDWSLDEYDLDSSSGFDSADVPVGHGAESGGFLAGAEASAARGGGIGGAVGAASGLGFCRGVLFSVAPGLLPRADSHSLLSGR